MAAGSALEYIAHRGTFSVDSGIVVSFRASAYQPHTTLATGVQILKYIKFPQGDKLQDVVDGFKTNLVHTKLSSHKIIHCYI